LESWSGLADITNETYTAEGPISYWNAYVAVTQMGCNRPPDDTAGLFLDIATVALVECSALRRFACVTGVARGNPVEVRDCPAAVIGNERVNSTGSHELGSDASRHGTRHRP
jgi:hypothetical protein